MLDLPMYIHQCTSHVAQSTMQAIIRTESKGNPLSIGLNKGVKLKYQATSNKQAKSWVKYLEDHRYNFDVGLAQVNIKNIHLYGYRAVDALDPCINLKLASAILHKNYVAARNSSNSSEEALQKALSAYNTGNYSRGFSNGYVQKVYANAGQPMPLNDISNSSSDHAQPYNSIIAENSNDSAYNQPDPRKSKSILYVRPKNAAAAYY